MSTPAAPDVELREEPLTAPAAARLLAELDADLAARYGGGTPVMASPAQFDARAGGVFLVAYRDGGPVACAGIRRQDAATAELKRMYVRPSARGTGVARRLLAALEAAARQAGYEQLWLETGLAQPEAIGLYTACGYTRVPDFGQYAGASGVRSFGKRLRPAPSGATAASGVAGAR